jgi:hypothetical protein
VYRDMRRRGVMHHMARGEQAEAMKRWQRSVTGARTLGLTMATEGHAGILLRRVKIVIFLFLFILFAIGFTRGEVLVPGSGRGLRGRRRGTMRAEETVAPGIRCLWSLGLVLTLDGGSRDGGRVNE